MARSVKYFRVSALDGTVSDMAEASCGDLGQALLENSSSEPR
jgi:hypothetical protein